MTHNEPQEGPEEVPAETVPMGPSAEASRNTRAIAKALLMVPVGGLIFLFSGNAVLYGWLEIVPKISYGEACGVMALAWLVRFFMYR